MTDPATLAFYEANASRYTMGSAQPPHPHLEPFLDRLPAGAAILELGCGAGRDAAKMIERGFVVDATDATPAMVRTARDLHGVPTREMRFDQLEAEEAYDAVWAHACLIHVPRAEIGAVLARVHRALKTGGWHFANYKLGDGEGRDPLGRLHNFPNADWIAREYAAAGFALVAAETYRGSGADGVVRDWHAVTLRKV